jgi:hypothetical protein
MHHYARAGASGLFGVKPFIPSPAANIKDLDYPFGQILPSPCLHARKGCGESLCEINHLEKLGKRALPERLCNRSTFVEKSAQPWVATEPAMALTVVDMSQFLGL